jgi:hypothetical protein
MYRQANAMDLGTKTRLAATVAATGAAAEEGEEGAADGVAAVITACVLAGRNLRKGDSAGLGVLVSSSPT